MHIHSIFIHRENNLNTTQTHANTDIVGEAEFSLFWFCIWTHSLDDDMYRKEY